MDSRLKELEKQLLAAQQQVQRAKEEKQRVEEEKQRVEEEKQRVEEEKQRAEEEIRETTLSEYIEACHDLIFTNFTVETNSYITSKGSITNPASRRCPSRLEPWTDFLEEQRTILGKLFSKFPARAEAFRSRHYLRTRGKVVAATRVGDEDALKLVLQDLVAEPVKLIVERLQNEDSITAEFDIGVGIAFMTRASALQDTGQGSTNRPMTPDARKLRPDQICAYKQDDGDLAGQTMAYIIEHKAPHKLTLPHLRLGLRPMDIYEEVVNRATIPVREDKVARFQYHADRLAAAAVTQTFDYMIQAGLTYGSLTTGEAMVFLKIDWTDPITLYYHLAEPGPEVDEHRDNFLCCTAVSQVLAFTILALDSQVHPGQDDRQRAIKKLKKWTEDWESIIQAISPDERAEPPPSPAYKPRTYKGIDRSPYLLRRTKTRAAGGRGGCKSGPSGRDPSPEASDDDRGGTRMPGTPTPAQPRRSQRVLARRQGGDSGHAGPSTRSGRATDRRYCSQKCLLGLVAGEDLDEGCPNIALHRGEDNDRRHPVDHGTWLSLLHEQLGRTLDDGIVPLGKEGARGVLFQVTLLGYGYTFVSKATTARFIGELEHEADVYGHVQRLQGVRVPVFLGVVDLREVGRTYYYEPWVHIVHLVLLSWGGSSLAEAKVSDAARVEREVVRSVQALHACGVVHTDVRDANMLWDGETGRVMAIDFERAVLAERPRPALGPGVPNKRPWYRGGVDIDTTAGERKWKMAVNLGMQHDIVAASMIFYRPA